MTEQRSFEHLLADRMEAERGSSRLPESFYEDFRLRARRMPQRPRWLAYLKEPPMRDSSNLVVGSPTLRIAAIVVATLLIALTVAGAGIGASRLLAADRPIVVDQSGGGTVTTINEAVAMAQDGDEILVKPGTYDESITITKDITLRGEDRDSVIVRPTGDTSTYDDFWWGPAKFSMLLLDSDADISDLSIRGNSYDFVIKGGAPSIHDINMGGANFVAYAGSSATVRDSTLGGWVHVDEQSPITIEDSSFRAIVANTDNTELVGGPVTIRNNSTQGIAFNGSALVEGNRVVAGIDSMADDFFGSGIDVQAGEGWLIKDNAVSGFAMGTAIDVASGAFGTVSGNTVSNSETGIAARGGGSIYAKNIVTGGGDGIVTMVGSAMLTDNAVSGASGRGFALSGSPVLEGNSSCDNGQNLWVADDATPVTDDSNDICEDAPAAAPE